MPGYILRFLPALAIFSCLFGCANYQLGTSGELTFATLHVAPVKMVALVPQAEPILSTQLRTAFINDGRVHVVNSPETADATLSMVVRNYQREVATVRPGDTGLARKFIITLTAEATLIDNRSGESLFTNRKLIVKRDIYTDSGQQQAEYQILPLLAEDLATKASHAVLDTW